MGRRLGVVWRCKQALVQLVVRSRSRVALAGRVLAVL
jgi:hypothetical protein